MTKRATGPDYRATRKWYENWVTRRTEALRNGGAGLVVVRCEGCGVAIASSHVDRAKGEPAVLMDFPENAGGWTCTRCGTCPTCGYLLCVCERTEVARG